MTHQPDERIRNFFERRTEIIAAIPDPLRAEFRRALDEFYTDAYGDGCDDTIGDYRYSGR